MLAHNHMTVTSKQLYMLKLPIILYVEGYSLVPAFTFEKLHQGMSAHLGYS